MRKNTIACQVFFFSSVKISFDSDVSCSRISNYMSLFVHNIKKSAIESQRHARDCSCRTKRQNRSYLHNTMSVTALKFGVLNFVRCFARDRRVATTQNIEQCRRLTLRKIYGAL